MTFLVYHVDSLDVPIRPPIRVYMLDQGEKTGVVFTNGVPGVALTKKPGNV